MRIRLPSLSMISAEGVHDSDLRLSIERNAQSLKKSSKSLNGEAGKFLPVFSEASLRVSFDAILFVLLSQSLLENVIVYQLCFFNKISLCYCQISIALIDAKERLD